MLYNYITVEVNRTVGLEVTVFMLFKKASDSLSLEPAGLLTYHSVPLPMAVSSLPRAGHFKLGFASIQTNKGPMLCIHQTYCIHSTFLV